MQMLPGEAKQAEMAVDGSSLNSCSAVLGVRQLMEICTGTAAMSKKLSQRGGEREVLLRCPAFFHILVTFLQVHSGKLTNVLGIAR